MMQLHVFKATSAELKTKLIYGQLLPLLPPYFKAILSLLNIFSLCFPQSLSPTIQVR